MHYFEAFEKSARASARWNSLTSVEQDSVKKDFNSAIAMPKERMRDSITLTVYRRCNSRMKSFEVFAFFTDWHLFVLVVKSGIVGGIEDFVPLGELPAIMH